MTEISHPRCSFQIVYVKIPHGRGCGFVQFVSRAAAESAIKSVHGTELGGCKVGMYIWKGGSVIFLFSLFVLLLVKIHMFIMN